MSDKLTNVINPQMMAPHSFTQSVFMREGSTKILDPAALESYLRSIVDTVNHNAQNLKDAADFITWVTVYKPNIIPEYRAHMVGEGLENEALRMRALASLRPM